MILHVLIFMRIFCFSQKLKLKEFMCDQSMIEVNELEPAHNLYKQFGPRSGPEVIKLFFILNSAEHEIYHAHKC